MSVRYIFNSSGDYVAFVTNDHLWSPQCDWLGVIVNGNEIYDPKGDFLGLITNDDRVVKNDSIVKPRILRPMKPFKPFKPFNPFKRLRMTPVPLPFRDVFEKGNQYRYAGSWTSASAPELSDYNWLLDSDLVASDGQPLGKVTRNRFDPTSLANEFGQYGSKFQANSIFNQFGPYGNPFSPLSPYNKFSQQGPRFIRHGKILGILTENTYITERIDPGSFIAWLKR